MKPGRRGTSPDIRRFASLRKAPKTDQITEADIWHMAILMVDKYGAAAALEVAVRCREALDHGDIRRCTIWRRMYQALEILYADEPAEGQAVH